MKLFPLLLAGSLLVPSTALAGNNNNGNGCRNRCGDTTTVNNSGDRYVDNSVINRANGGAGGQGGQGGTAYGGTANGGNGYGGNGGTGYAYSDGGDATIQSGAVSNNVQTGDNILRGGDTTVRTGDTTITGGDTTVTGGNQRNVVRGSGNSDNSNVNRARGGDQSQSQSQSNSQSQSSSSASSADNKGNRQNIVIEGDEREVPIAPLPTTDSIGRIGDVVVPLPNVGLGGFASTQSNGELDYGVSVGVRIPLGTGSFREAAAAEARRRTDRANFRLIQEAVWLRDQGLLSQEAHPRHYAALYGPSAEKFVF